MRHRSDAAQLERLLERRELVIEEVDPGAERRLEEPRVGGGDAAPLQRVQVGSEMPWWIEVLGVPETAVGRARDLRAELALREHRHWPPLGIVIEADQANERGVLGLRIGSDDLIDQVLPVADRDDVTSARQVAHTYRLSWKATDLSAGLNVGPAVAVGG